MVVKILAAAVGDPANNKMIQKWGDAINVRAYIPGLMQGLVNLGWDIGADYFIEYRENTEDEFVNHPGKPTTFGPPTTGGDFDVILCMSTNVVRWANKAVGDTIKIVGIVSDPHDEQFATARNISGVSARRHQTAGDCFDRFHRTVPSLTTIFVFHKPGYAPSEAARGRVHGRKHHREEAVGAPITIISIEVKKASEIDQVLAGWSNPPFNLPSNPGPAEAPTIGMLVLPIDICFARAAKIIGALQPAPHYIPTFFPTTDWVKASAADLTASALGGYGISQRKSGELLAERVDYVLKHEKLPAPRFTDAPDHCFEWWVSGDIANLYKLQLSPEIPVLS
jgi:hypothetical protein